MTTPKELADKAKQQIEVAKEAWTATERINAESALRATIDQLQAMAEARQGSGEPDDMKGMSPINREIAYSAAAKLRALGYEWSGKDWQGSGAKDAERYRTFRSYATGNAIEQMLAQSAAAERSAHDFDAAVDALILARRKSETTNG